MTMRMTVHATDKVRASALRSTLGAETGARSLVQEVPYEVFRQGPNAPVGVCEVRDSRQMLRELESHEGLLHVVANGDDPVLFEKNHIVKLDVGAERLLRSRTRWSERHEWDLAAE
jgi:hypothetical protein